MTTTGSMYASCLRGNKKKMKKQKWKKTKKKKTMMVKMKKETSPDGPTKDQPCIGSGKDKLSSAESGNGSSVGEASLFPQNSQSRPLWPQDQNR